MSKLFSLFYYFYFIIVFVESSHDVLNYRNYYIKEQKYNSDINDSIILNKDKLMVAILINSQKNYEIFKSGIYINVSTVDVNL